MTRSRIVRACAAVLAVALAGCTASSTLRVQDDLHMTTISIGPARPLTTGALGINGATIRSSSQIWSNDRFGAAVATLAPGSIRLFGGSSANYWNWRAGRFYSGHGVPSLYTSAAATMTKIPLSSFAEVFRRSGATPVYDLNMVTSTLPDQLALLRQAQHLGLAVTRVELGNELYFADPLILARFPTAASYGEAATAWAAAIKQAFPGVQVAAVGAPAQDEAGATVSERQRTWNAGMLPHLRGVDALTFHPYFRAGVTAGRSLDTAAATQAAMVAAGERVATAQATDLAQLPAGMSAWYTEWNLLDRVVAVQGTWAQSLEVMTFGLLQFSDPRVTLSCLHDLVGSGASAALFGTSNGFRFGAQLHGAPAVRRPGPVPTTQPFDRSATGVAAAVLFSQFDHATSLAPLSMSPAVPLGDLRTGGLVGVALRTPSGTGGILLNLTTAPIEVSLPAALAHDRITVRSAALTKLVTKDADVQSSSMRYADVLDLPAHSVAELNP